MEFRFENMAIWQKACDVADQLCEAADAMERKRLYAFADQLRRAALSVSNNIAEGSGSVSSKDFRNFLNYARRSVFECASMILFFERKGYVATESKAQFLPQLSELSRMITGFQRTLKE